MIRRDRVHLRIGSRYFPYLMAASIIASVGIALIASFHFMKALAGGRTTVIAAGSGGEAVVLSWDRQRGKLTIIEIPGDVRMDGVYGKGQLPLGSFLHLEDLDRGGKQGLFVKTVGDALGLPIAGFLRISSGAPIGKEDAINAFSPFHPSGWRSGSLPRGVRFRLWWEWRSIRPDAVWPMRLEDLGVFRQEVLPDGSLTRVFDTERFDSAAAGRLEVAAVRREAKRVLIVNTTGLAGLGSRAGRVLSQAGIAVAAVESETALQTSCSIHARKELWDGPSVRFIRFVFACTLSEEGNDSRVDITVRLGLREADDYR